jgi:carbonic anhydrase
MVNVRHTAPVNAETGLQHLLAGNQRFAAGTPLHPRRTLQTLAEVAGAQHPFAVILGCSDSRVPPEIIFDQGLGDLYVSRTAGPVVYDAVLGSIELAVANLGIRLIVVLGHEHCVAVEAAVRALHPPLVAGAPAIWTWQAGWTPVRVAPSGNLGALTRAIIPAVARAASGPGTLLERAIRSNIALVVEQLRASTPIQAMGEQVRVVGAYYSLHTGQVHLQP